MKIVFLDARTVGNLAEIRELEKFGTLQIFQTTRPDQTLQRIKGAEIVITNKVVIDKKIMEKSPDLKLICVAATGTNNIDLAAAEKRGVAVRNVKGYSTASVAQHTFAMIFGLLNHLAFYNAYVKSGKYSRSPVFTCLDREIVEIKDKVFGIIGLGAIGERVAELATAFGARVIFYSTSGQHDHGKYQRVSLDALLAASDIISIHAPLNDNTRNLIRLAELKKARPNCLLINTGRGGIVHEKDLVTALNKNLIFAAAFDVYEKEPIPRTHPFFKVKDKERLLLTPHIAWAGIGARKALMRGVEANIKAYITRN